MIRKSLSSLLWWLFVRVSKRCRMDGCVFTIYEDYRCKMHTRQDTKCGYEIDF